MNDLADLYSAWRYEFEYWKRIHGFNPLSLVESEDRSPSWEMNRFHIFELENGTYVTVLEQGCSCYDPSWAEIDFHRTLEEAKERMNDWRNR